MNQKSKQTAGRVKAAAVPSSALASSVSETVGEKGSRWLVLGVCLFLAAIVWMVFGQTLHHEFVRYDDNDYVYENLVVQKGLTWEGLRWSLTYGNIGHWHPLTWLSHMLDCQLYGLSPGAHHFTNILLHTATVILLFLVLRRMTGSLWRSAFVAAVFAIHPLRVESVAWVAERKDVLSGLFFMLMLIAYVGYVRHPCSMLRYGVVVLLYTLGLLSKNMLVTTPFVLLLLDYWPLNRFPNFTPQVWLRRVAEKIPLLVLTVGSCVATALVPEKVAIVDSLCFSLRLENAVASYVTYLWQMVHPLELACLYPNPTNYLPLWQVAGALGSLLALFAAVWAFRRTCPYLIVGWLWYVGMLVPVIGLVQISYYAHADRYTYLPQIGLYLLLTWGVAELSAGWRHRHVVLGGLSAIILVALMFCARVQTSYWRNTESLWMHTLACTSGNYIGHINLGNALLQRGEVDEAMVQYQQALQINPNDVEAHNNLGNVLHEKGQVGEAITQYLQALQINPNYAEACYNLGNALVQRGEVDEAMVYLQQALQIKPDYAEAHDTLGIALFKKGQVDEAIAHFQKALQIKPDYAKAHVNLGNALLQKNRMGEAIIQYQKALQITPDSAAAQNNLAWVLATAPQASLRDGNQAVKLARQANQPVGSENPIFLHTLAAAYAETGQFSEAVETAQRALQLAEVQSNTALADEIRSQLKLYQAGIPFHSR